MQIAADIRPRRRDLGEYGLENLALEHWDLNATQLLEQAIQRREGLLSNDGALVVRTGQFTGRSPKDKYIIRDAGTEHTVAWGPVNQPITPKAFDRLFTRMRQYWQGREIFVNDLRAGADPNSTLPIRIVAERAWHALFGHQLFVRPPVESPARERQFTVFFAPRFVAGPAIDGTRSETCIAINFRRRMILIAGTEYAGELKKSIFTILNYLLPDRGVMPMHCSANAGADGTVALFFGLSGTGKTTLSADPTRRLIGDDEHGWSASGVFNFEGGCYAKCTPLSKEKQPPAPNPIRTAT